VKQTAENDKKRPAGGRPAGRRKKRNDMKLHDIVHTHMRAYPVAR